ncbi:MAG TPA: flagellar export chaperone FlgN [Ignavibacteriales bacterium]|jgi:endonuclease III-like uncharacterized protein|nr:flagellar export chaperone FlgN [Ignavibacteriales bacterium]
MEVLDLIEALQEQEKNLTNLNETALHKQKALVSSDYEELQKTIVVEEKLLLNIQSAERMRLEAVKVIREKYSLSGDVVKVAHVIENLRNKIELQQLENLTVLEARIKELIKTANVLNQKNKFLIDHSRSFIKETILSLLGEQKKHALLDRKI